MSALNTHIKEEVASPAVNANKNTKFRSQNIAIPGRDYEWKRRPEQIQMLSGK